MRQLELPRRTKLSDHLVLHLAREVVSGRLKPGEAAPPESELAAAFDISKPVVRESIQALVGLGLLRVQQGKRTQVLPPQEWNVLAPIVQQAHVMEGRAEALTVQFYEVRLALEGQAAAWAAERARPEDREAIATLAGRMDAIADGSRDVQAFLEVDRHLHSAIASAAGNDVLLGVLRNLQSFLSRAWTNSRVRPEHLPELADQHRALARAVVAGDPKTASLAMQAHLERAMRIETAESDGRGTHRMLARRRRRPEA